MNDLQERVAAAHKRLFALVVHICDYGRIEIGTPQSKELIDIGRELESISLGKEKQS
jgi:hypothetical protein